ncbi:hypothetical protein TVAG_218230 [Trichomonas vaginalis G3]|uniref:Uncharacterized protein n=1 Tax=Trichomonas vaginalis (strain ATCC PRA-98 / G3) TaxID=412133 RepID=A2FD16_TRIV3|nr:armadillo (ARM) repeat-containing protein family [Trichomonas vaginalis G3]EAX97209.1 hypothetical protein TVAG_218230 [Trichomonas vaginalis G3]KAI5536198.1 armadillo (ARM) repeat-containing protein family [Trichomonas vaginalis G3]|eukprot:XP_001310139.1 hypothetical protein [Trichomonas vaginalis G3]
MSKKEESDSSYEYTEEEDANEPPAPKNEKKQFDFGNLEELVKQNKIEEAIDKCLNVIGTSPTYFEAALGKIITIILKTSYKSRCAYYVIFKEVIRRFQGKIRAYDIYKAILKRCQHSQNVEIKIARNSCLVTCISCISRAGLFKDNKEECLKQMKQVYRITSQAPPIRLLGFEILIDMIQSNGFTQEEFNEKIYPIFHGKFDPEEPNNIDLLYLHTQFYKMFPEGQFIDDIKNISKLETLKKYTPILQASARIRNLHPIWPLICSFDAQSLYNAASELWIEGGDDLTSPKHILAHALAAWVPHASNQDIVSLIQNQSLFLAAANAGRGQEFRDVLSKKIRTIESEKIEVAVGLLNIAEESNYVMKEVHQILTYMDDEQTRTVFERVKDTIKFDSFSYLLNAQKNRKTGSDDKLIAEIFEVACSKCDSDFNRKTLSKFLTSVSNYKTPAGSDFLSVLTGKNFTQPIVCSDVNSLVNSTNAMLDNLDQIHKKMKFSSETKIGRCHNLDEFVQLMRNLHDTEFPHLKKIACAKIEDAIPFLRKEDSDLVKLYPIIIPKALEKRELCEAALDAALSNFKELPDRTKEALINMQEINLPLESSEASALLPNLLRKNEIGAFSEKAIKKVIDMSDHDQKVTTAAERASEIINQNGSTFGAGGINRIIETTEGAASAVLKAIEENISKAQMGNNNIVKIVHEWVYNSIGKATDDEVRHVAIDFAKRNYQSNPDGNKRLEINMSWVYKVVKHLTEQGAPELFAPLYEIVKDRKSKRAKRLIFHLSGKSNEPPKEEDVKSEEENQ